MFWYTQLLILMSLTHDICFAKIKRTKEPWRRIAVQKALFSRAFRDSYVVPDVLDVVPYQKMKVVYEGDVKVDQGNELTPTQVKNPPSVKWICNPNKFHTLCMTDPDAPSREDPKFREWHHWLVVNIPGSNVSQGETLSEYIGSGPPNGTGLHRYVFLAYEQKGKLDFSKEPRLTNRSGDNRANFHIRDFVAKHNITELVAGNFFQAQWDEYVPILYKQLGE